VQAADASVASAQAKLDQLVGRPQTGDLAAAQGAVATTQAALTSAQAKLAQLQSPDPDDVQAARVAVDAARTNYASAQAKLDQVRAGATDADRTAAQAAVDAGQANVRSAQAKLDQLMAGPQDADLVAAQTALAQAQNNLQLKLAPYTDADFLAQQQAVRQAQANLQQLLSPSTQYDLEAQRQAVRSAQATLALKQTPYLPADILSAQAAVDQAQANLADAQTNLDGAVITAPFDGMVSAVGINAGEIATGETTAATSTITVVDPDQVRIDVQADESDVAQLSVGLPATVTFDALGGRPLQGTVTAISPTGTTTQGVVGYQVSIVLRNARGVRPGMTATAQITTAERDDVLMIPNRALARVGQASGGQGQAPGAAQGQAPGSAQGQQRAAGGQGQGRFGGAGGQAAGGVEGAPVQNAGRPAQVRVVTPNGVDTRTIQVGLANDQNTEVISGLEEGDEVVLPTTAARAAVPGAGNTGGGNVVFGGAAPARRP